MQKSNVIRMINMEFDSNMKFCQSCAMPMTEELYGSNKDGSKNEDYCTAMKMVNLQQIYLWKK